MTKRVIELMKILEKRFHQQFQQYRDISSKNRTAPLFLDELNETNYKDYQFDDTLYDYVDVIDERPYIKNEILISNRNFYKQKLNEGYDIIPNITVCSKDAIKEISKIFCIPEYYFYCQKRNSSDKIASFIILECPAMYVTNPDKFNKLYKAFLLFGYFHRLKRPEYFEDNDIVRFQFEPWYYGNNRIVLPKYLYHGTTKAFAENIQQNGFMLKHNRNAKYPERIYFFIDKFIDKITGILYSTKKVDKSKQDKNGICIFKIDSDKTNAKFYSDPHYFVHSTVYTYDIINKDAISDVENLQI